MYLKSRMSLELIMEYFLNAKMYLSNSHSIIGGSSEKPVFRLPRITVTKSVCSGILLLLSMLFLLIFGLLTWRIRTEVDCG